MIRNLKKIIFLILNISKVFGYKIHINRLTSNTSFNLIDKNSWEPYLNFNENFFFKVYNESIIKSKSLNSDSLQKQLRFFSLFNIIKNILKNQNYENFVECGCWNGHSTYGIAMLLKKYK